MFSFQSEMRGKEEKGVLTAVKSGGAMYPRDGVTQEERSATKDGFLYIRTGRELKRQFSLATCKEDGGLGMSGTIQLFMMEFIRQRRLVPEVRSATPLEQVAWAGREVTQYTDILSARQSYYQKPGL